MLKKIVLLVIFLFSNLYSEDIVKTDLHEFIRFVSNNNNMNIIVDETIQESISVTIPSNFTNDDLKMALINLLAKHGYVLNQNGTFAYITKKKPVDTFIYTYKCNNFDLSIIKNKIKEIFPKVNFVINNNILFFKTTKLLYENIYSTLKMLDTKLPSRLLKISIISYTYDDLSSIGMNFKVSELDNFSNIGEKPTSEFIGSVLSTLLPFKSSNLNAGVSFGSVKLNVLLDALYQNGTVLIEARPIFTIVNGQNYVFNISERIAVSTGSQKIENATSTTSNQLQYEDIGLILNISNVNINEKNLFFDLKINDSNIIDYDNDTFVPTVSKRSLNTKVELENNKTVLITGLRRNINEHTISKFPILGDLPIIDNVFKHESNTEKIVNYAVFLEVI